MARIECYDIEWETDGEKVDLPKSVVIDLEEDEDLTLEEIVDNEGADALSDKYGWLVNGFHWKVAKSNS